MIDKGDIWFIVTIMVLLLIGLLAVFALGADIAQIIWGG